MTSEEAKYLRTHPMKDKLDPKALEAFEAKLDCRLTHGEPGRELRVAITAYLDVADLVPRQWVHDLQSGMFINCVYCGHCYGPDDEVPATMADALKEHIAQCPKHPMSAMKAERDEARCKADELAQDLKLATNLAHGSDKLWDERGKQLAALREALEQIAAEILPRKRFRSFKFMNRGICADIARGVLDDTAPEEKE